jgi:hypothetical protein
MVTALLRHQAETVRRKAAASVTSAAAPSLSAQDSEQASDALYPRTADAPMGLADLCAVALDPL